MLKQVCVIGLGYIGLPTACILATSDYIVHGVDINDKLIEIYKSAKFTSPEPALQELFLKVLEKGKFFLSTKVTRADIYIIAVPTPLTLDNQPDLSYVEAAVESIKPHLCENNIVIIESTCPVGTTDKISQDLKKLCPDIYVAYCPERAFPGNILYELIHNDRIVGGIDDASTYKVSEFYKSFTCGHIFSTKTRIAEAVKLAENSFRDVNIAFANELSMIADNLNFDVNEVIRLANRHPRVQILNPGVGVGGHCIAIDPWFLASNAPEFAKLISTAREVNLKKTDWVIEKIKDTIKATGAKVIACLGLTYKANVSDTRNSPALQIVKAIEQQANILCVDPYIDNSIPLSEAISKSEMVIILVDHDEFKHITSASLCGKIILDFVEALT